MVETGKRSRPIDGARDRYNDNDRINHKRRSTHRESSQCEELVVYRILCPSSVIGSVIGKSGRVIKSLREDTKARIEVVDPYPGADKRVMLVYCYVKNREYVEIEGDLNVLEPLCPAQDALIKVHEAIVTALANTEYYNKDNKEEAELLVPSSQSAVLIGKSGTTIKRLRFQSKADIKVSLKEMDNASHSCAMEFDNFVQIIGDSKAVKKALFSLSAIMYNHPPKEEISLDIHVPGLPPSIIVPSDLPIYPAASLYAGAGTLLTSPIGVYPFQPEVRGHKDTYGNLPVYVSDYSTSKCLGEVTVYVLCPSDKIGRVIGRGGSVIKGIRDDSGAKIEVDDKKSKDNKCVITITSTESTKDEKSGVVEAILLLQEKINDDGNEIVTIELLIPSTVIGCLIGKNGATISHIRRRTDTKIYISRGDDTKIVGSDNELVQVSGGVGNVRDALAQLALKLRENILGMIDQNEETTPTYGNIGYSGSFCGLPILPIIPPSAPLGGIRGNRCRVEMLPSSSLYAHGNSQKADGRRYKSESPRGSKSYPERSSAISEIVIPPHAHSKVMGKGGSNLMNICSLSGAHIKILDSHSSRSECIAQISGTAEQKRAAETMIQAFILST